MSLVQKKQHRAELEPIEERVHRFVIRVVKLVRALPKSDMAAQIVGRQLLRAATSIGANVEGGLGGCQSA